MTQQRSLPTSAVAAVAGVAVDQLCGEPPVRWHPVAAYGSLMERVERHLYAPRRAAGAGFALIGAGIGIVVGLTLGRLLGRTAATAVVTAICAAGRMLDDEANTICALLHDGDLAAARSGVRSLVGRSTDDLDDAEISRAVIESVAENCVDAVTASMWWAGVGGAPAVLAHRAINTLDAMVGHRNERYREFGWASAKLDDALNYVPARLTAVAVAVVRPRRAREIRHTVRRDAPGHPSPNGGVVESAFAAALGVRLGGINRYGDVAEDRGTLGHGPAPTSADIVAAVRLRRDATAAAAALLLAVDTLAHGAAGLLGRTRRR